MRRIVMSLLGTLFATCVLIGLKTPASPLPLAVPAEAALDPTGGVAAGAGTGGGAGGGVATVPGATLTPGPGGSTPAPGSTTARPGGSTTQTANPGTPSSPGKTTSSAPPPASRTITGTAVRASSFGNMQVRIVVTGRHIDSIATIQVSNRPGNTVSVLTPAALSAQAVPTNHISGATYSEQAWKQSLQSAINQI